VFRAALAALLICGGILFAPAANAFAESPVGNWQTPDGDSVITIASCGTGYCGHISGMLLDGPPQAEPKDWRGLPKCGDVIINAQGTSAPNQWHGTVTDPRNGTVWHATLTLRDGTLYLRGYVGLPIFGATQAWTPFNGTIAANCHITVGS
jgi:uncharacterized protein (DUF2147 family)